MEDIVFKDTESYFGILYQGKTTKWICRFILTDNKKTIIIPDENKKEIKHSLQSVYEAEKYIDELKAALNRYIK